MSVSTHADAVVELRGVTRSFVEGRRRHLVLDTVDLRIAAGSFVVLLGRSGTGKSTLLNLVGGIDAPDAGDVCIAGTTLTRLGEHERTLYRRAHIGFVFQFFNLVPTLTVLENVVLPLELLRGRDAANHREAVALLGRVGLDDRAASFPDRLSGGEQQRVAVARALVHEPHLVLADEPTGNLDPEIADDVLELLTGLIRRRGTTLMVATHSREVAARADRVLRIEDHSLVEVTDAP